ncbi:NUDIX hydrolase N-terminal domain-containing protein [Thomasclavelia spiroformis]|uniref:NUDIX hydrolase N-terminal domain-containing protein n=1 Tax=Thomasclavelia spiroformis TaxID=29348 RepID=UPI003993F7D9
MEKWLKWAIEIQCLAKIGLTYTRNIFDIERYERLKEISVEMLVEKIRNSTIKVKDLFCNET